MPMSLAQSNERNRMISNRNREITRAIAKLVAAMEAYFEIDATWELYAAEDHIRTARDWNTEANEIRKAGMRK